LHRIASRDAVQAQVDMAPHTSFGVLAGLSF
jgi:hypothetical protein